MNFVALLLGLAAPLVSRVFIALGISIVTYAGLSLILDQITTAITNNMAGIVGKTVQIAAILGFQQAVGIILAAIATKVAMTQLTAWVKS